MKEEEKGKLLQLVKNKEELPDGFAELDKFIAVIDDYIEWEKEKIELQSSFKSVFIGIALGLVIGFLIR